MPQVYMILGPGKDFIGIDTIREIGLTLMNLVEQSFGIQGKNDVAFTAVQAITTHGEADIQIEIRYTAGKDEYEWGRPFDPTEEDQRILATQITQAVNFLTLRKFKCSVWFKPYYNSVFIMKT